MELKNCDKLSEELFCIWKRHKAVLMDLRALPAVPVICMAMLAHCNGRKYIINPYLFKLWYSMPHINKTAWITAVLSTLKMDGFIWAGKTHFNERLGQKSRKSFIHWFVFCITSSSAWSSDISFLTKTKANKSSMFLWNRNDQITIFYPAVYTVKPKTSFIPNEWGINDWRCGFLISLFKV